MGGARRRALLTGPGESPLVASDVQREEEKDDPAAFTMLFPLGWYVLSRGEDVTTVAAMAVTQQETSLI